MLEKCVENPLNIHISNYFPNAAKHNNIPYQKYFEICRNIIYPGFYLLFY